MFSGAIVALISPFTKDDAIDEKRLRKLVDFQIENGIDGIVPCGTTGESPTLSHAEHKKVIEIVIEQANKRVPIIAGTGSNSTSEAIELTKHAKDAEADGVLMIAPYYNRPTQTGLFEHFKAIGSEVDIPIVLYNHQGRTGITIEPETIAKLAETVKVVGVKDASGGIDYTSKVISLCGGRVTVLSGNDTWTLALMALGAKGVISVAANILPRNMSDLVSEYLRGNVEKAKTIHYELLPFMKAMDLEVNPVPVKTAMKLMGKIEGTLRLPLASMKEENINSLKKTLQKYKLL